jgi:hypothetical protein
MRALLLVTAACTASAGPTPTEEVFAIDPHGGASGVDIEVLALAPRVCPCPKTVAADSEGALIAGGNVPCQCPAALAMWRDQLQHCAAPAPVAKVRSAPGGHAIVPVIAGATLHAATTAGEAWIAQPAASARLALELGERIAPRVKITGRDTPTAAAILYEDGHCVPLHAAGGLWQSREGVSIREPGVVFAVGRSGAAAVDWSPSLGGQESVELEPARTVFGACSAAGLHVHLRSAHQELDATSGKGGVFRFERVLAQMADVACLDATGKLVDEFLTDPQFGLVEMRQQLSGPGDELPCVPIEVVDASGAPVANAQLIVTYASNGLGSGHGDATDAAGRACVDAQNVTIMAPIALGDHCAGARDIKIQPWHPDRKAVPQRFVLDVRPLPRTKWRGRLVNAEHVPIAAASVYVDSVASGSCSARVGTWLTSRADGSIELSSVPVGKLELEAEHWWYAKTRFQVDDTAASPPELVLERPSSWHGHLFDPDGHALTACEVFARAPHDVELQARCGKSGELALDHIGGGELAVKIVLVDSPLGQRTLSLKLTIRPGEQHEQDIRWPGGESIAGRVVDAKGVPVPDARVLALPKGAAGLARTDGGVMVKTDSQGRFELRYLAPGAWTLEANGEPLAGTATLDAQTGRRDVAVALAPRP